MKTLISKKNINPQEYLKPNEFVCFSDALVTGKDMDTSLLVLESKLKEVICVCYYDKRGDECEDFFSTDSLAEQFIILQEISR